MTYIRLSLYKRLNTPKFEKISVPFDSVGSTNNRILGQFKTDVTIDGLTFAFTLDIVSDDLISHDLIIGDELLDHAEVKLKKKQLTLTKINETSNGQRNENQPEIEFC